VNAIRIFNEKRADELIFLDITATKENRIMALKTITEISDECFMPFSVGGGIRTIEHVQDVIAAGAEKVIINTYAVENPSFIEKAANRFGSQSIVVSIDVRSKAPGKYEVYTNAGTKSTGLNPLDFAKLMELKGAGEIFINSIDRDGTMEGYDTDLIKIVSDAVGIPVIACGGAGSVADLKKAITIGHASAASAGSMFVFQGRHRAVLITYPSSDEMKDLFTE
jgi:imidazole glycerol-phosphate synthase subunit HisF